MLAHVAGIPNCCAWFHYQPSDLCKRQFCVPSEPLWKRSIIQVPVIVTPRRIYHLLFAIDGSFPEVVVGSGGATPTSKSKPQYWVSRREAVATIFTVFGQTWPVSGRKRSAIGPLAWIYLLLTCLLGYFQLMLPFTGNMFCTLCFCFKSPLCNILQKKKTEKEKAEKDLYWSHKCTNLGFLHLTQIVYLKIHKNIHRSRAPPYF